MVAAVAGHFGDRVQSISTNWTDSGADHSLFANIEDFRAMRAAAPPALGVDKVDVLQFPVELRRWTLDLLPLVTTDFLRGAVSAAAIEALTADLVAAMRALSRLEEIAQHHQDAELGGVLKAAKRAKRRRDATGEAVPHAVTVPLLKWLRSLEPFRTV